MPFKKGKEKTGGRKKGTPNHNGLTECLGVLQKVMAKEKNLKKLAEAFQQAFDGNFDHITRARLGFYFKFVMPLYPKNLSIEHSGVIEAIAKIHLEPLKKKNGNNKK